MRKISLIGFVMLIVSIPTFAGGLLTNTNQHAAFLRMLSRGATFEIDGALSNPAGLAFLPNDGFHMGLSIQSAFQTRNIDASFMTYSGLDLSNPAAPVPTVSDQPYSKYYKGKAAAPVIPSVFAAYKKGDWTISGFFAITAGGGKASFDDGLPIFESAAMAKIFQKSLDGVAQGGPIMTPDKYIINSAMDGRQYIYSLQLGLSYKITDWLSAFAGARMNYFSGGYEGFLDAKVGDTDLMNLALDCDQTGWGITPILGADVKLGKWNIGLKYEFMTSLNLENKTKKAEVRQMGNVMGDEGNPLADYKDGVNTPSDIPALLTAAVGYEILPTLRATVEYHHFFDKAAGMANDKQKALKHGTHEILLGAEWDVTKQLTISGGYQNTDYGLADDFQSDISFSCDSYSLGFGAAIKMTKHLTMNVAYFWTNYKDYNKMTETALGASSTTYRRTNKVFGLGVDYKF